MTAMPTVQRKVYWTPARINRLIEATGSATGREFAKLVRVSESVVSEWKSGIRVPQPVMELALDRIASQHGLQTSG
jgi:DNA-binding transcriptional regulator YiaG